MIEKHTQAWNAKTALHIVHLSLVKEQYSTYIQALPNNRDWSSSFALLWKLMTNAGPTQHTTDTHMWKWLETTPQLSVLK